MTAPRASRDDAFLARLRRSPPTGRHDLLVRRVTAAVPDLLGWDPGEVGAEDGFLDLGFDSLLAVDFKILLEGLLGCALPSTVLFDCPTPSSLAHTLLEVLEAAGLDAEDDAARRPDPAGDIRAASPGDGAPPRTAADGSGARVEPCAAEPGHGPGAAPRSHDAGRPAGADRGLVPPDPSTLPREELEAAYLRQTARLQAMEAGRHEPLAIVGLACRFPGAADAEAFWRLQAEGRDAVGEVPPDRWDVDLYYDPDPSVPGRMATRRGGFVEGVDRFDARLFGISPREAVQLDPQQRLLLETTWEALEDAAIAAGDLAGTATGVFIGTRGAEYFQGHTDWRPEDAETYYATGNAVSTLAGRLSFLLGLTGPCFALDTACSSSLVALHAAVQSLRRGECSAAIVGGVNLVLDPFGTIAICKASMLSPDGRCKTFDASADGYVRAEGCGVVVLVRESRAVAEGHRIHALVRGTAINQDGASGGLTVPSSAAQADVIRKALHDARLAPGDVDYVEAHGTGTSLGDPLEVAALDAVFGADRPEGRPLLVGSVKTNIGHAEPAAGIAGLAKVVLAFRHGTLPPLLHLETPNPHIDWARTCVAVTTETTPWPSASRPRRAGVSSFGFSGTNAHVVLEEAPAEVPRAGGRSGPHLVVLSGHLEAAREEAVTRLADHLASHPDLPLADVAATTLGGRARLAHRLALVAGDTADLAARLAGGAPGAFRGRLGSHAPRVAFLYTGQGSQHPGMGRELDAAFSVFRHALDRCAEALAPHLAVPLRELLWGSATDRLHRTDATQPALFALEVALTELWRSFGIVPAWVAGHSVGEFAAAVCAGVMSLEDAAALVAARGRLMVERTTPGAMAAVFAEADVLQPHLAAHAGRLDIAAWNCAGHLVLSGDADAVEATTRALAEDGIASRPLEVSHAFHSPLMEPMQAAFADALAGVTLRRPATGFVSMLDPGPADQALASADYWVRHVREPVRFVDGTTSLLAQGVDVLVEIGPAPVLLGMARRFADGPERAWLPSLRPGTGPVHRLLESAGELFVRGAPLNAEGLHRDSGARRVALPSYPFQRERYWLDGRKGRSRTLGVAGRDHPLLGPPREVAALGPSSLLFEGDLHADDPAWLADHRTGDEVLVPAAAFVETALAAAAAGQGPAVVEEVEITSPLVLGDEPTPVQLVRTIGEDEVATFRLDARPPGATGWTAHAHGRLGIAAPDTAPPALDLDALAARCTEPVDLEDYYRLYAEVGLDYGPAFRTVAALARGHGEALARLELPEDVGDAAACVLHPALLDGAFQSCRTLALQRGHDELYLPVGIERLAVTVHGARRAVAHLRLRPVPDDGRVLVMDIRLAGDDGAPIAAVEGLTLVRTNTAALLALTDPLRSLAHIMTWPPCDPTPAADGAILGPVLVAGTAGGLGEALVERLGARGVEASWLAVDEVPPEASAWDERLGAAGPVAHVVHLAAAEGDARDDPTDDGIPTGRHAARAGPDAHAATEGASRGTPGDRPGAPATTPSDPHAPHARHIASALGLLGALARSDPRPAPRVWLVTRGTVAAGVDAHRLDLDGAPLWGLGAAVALEHPAWRTTRVDLDPAAGADDLDTLHDLLASDDDETQVAWRSGRRHVARLARAHRADAGLAPEAPGPWTLRVRRYGALDQLAMLPAPRRAPGPGEVEIEVSAAALNFKDVLFALGLLAEHTAIAAAPDQPLGLECAGRVIATGEGVDHVAPGDEVLASGTGLLASHATVPAHVVARRPAHLGRLVAAGVQTVFLTALYGLLRRARLRSGERVLIHAAAGGVGQAALAVARRAGGEVFATASRGKWDPLRRQGVVHVMDSRSLDFADEVLAATGGEGVDVVLNSLAGETIDASLRCLARGGRFVEIGKLGASTADGAAAMRPDVEHHAFDMAEVLAADPGLHRELLDELVTGLADGSLVPPPTRAWPVARAEAAFGHLAQGRNVGKVVLTLPPTTGERAPVRADGTYLVTGGLGALGLATAGWLVDRGARHLVLTGRRAPSAEAASALAELEARGARVEVAAVDVTDAGAMGRLVAGCTPPLAGVVHAAGVLDDALLGATSWQRAAAVLAPKVAGARVLDEVTAEQPLDLFVLYSSMVGMVGNAGQSAYAAANAFLDALAADRRARGLPALSIGWGPWAGAGMAAGADDRHRARLDEAGVTPLDRSLALAALERLLTDPSTPAHVGILPVTWSRWLAALGDDLPPVFGPVAPAGGGGARDNGDEAFLRTLATAPPGELAPLVDADVRGQLARVMGHAGADAVDPDQPFVDMGIDSLLAVDLRNRLEARYATELPATLVFDHPTPADLVTALVDALRARPAAGEATASAPGRRDGAARPDQDGSPPGASTPADPTAGSDPAAASTESTASGTSAESVAPTEPIGTGGAPGADAALLAEIEGLDDEEVRRLLADADRDGG